MGIHKMGMFLDDLLDDGVVAGVLEQNAITETTFEPIYKADDDLTEALTADEVTNLLTIAENIFQDVVTKLPRRYVERKSRYVKGADKQEAPRLIRRRLKKLLKRM